MKLSMLYEETWSGKLGTILKKQADPGSPEIVGVGAASNQGNGIQQTSRSGNQNSPLTKVRYKRYFNAPDNNRVGTDKVGDPNQTVWSDPASARPRPSGTTSPWGSPPASQPLPRCR